MMISMPFKPKAQILLQLGEQLIKSESVAILELIKNAYDADAKRAYIEQRNNVKNGEVLELLMPDGELFPLTLEDMRNADGESIDCAPHAQQKFSIVSDRALMPDSLLRRKVIC